MLVRIDAQALVSACASLVCFVFAAVLFGLWRGRQRPYQLVWSAGLFWYALAAGADALGQTVGWTEATYRVWYLFGAIAAAAWLGLGEVYLFRTTGFGELVALGVFGGALPPPVRGGRLPGPPDQPAASLVRAAPACSTGAGGAACFSSSRPSPPPPRSPPAGSTALIARPR